MSVKIPKFYYVYLITNLILNKQYIGSRICYKEDPNTDGYMGSSKYLSGDYKIYGIENFTKEKIYFKEKGNHYEYFWNFFFEAFYLINMDEKTIRIREYFYKLFDFKECFENISANFSKHSSTPIIF